MGSVLVHFNLSSDYPLTFPKTLQMSEKDPITNESFQTLFDLNQQAFLPSYCIAVAESANEEDEIVYRIYDATSLSALISGDTTSLSGESIFDPDPAIVPGIRKIHYFGLNCFEFDKKQICSNVDLLTNKNSLNNWALDDYDESVQGLILKSVDRRFFSDQKYEDDRKIIRIAQHGIANLIDTGGLFSELTPENGKKEALRWLWCSSKGSYRGLVSVVRACLTNKDLIPDAERIAYSTIVHQIKKSPSDFITEDEKKGYIQAISKMQSLGMKLSERGQAADVNEENEDEESSEV